MRSNRTSAPAAPSDLTRQFKRACAKGIRPEFEPHDYLSIVAHLRERGRSDEALAVAEAGLSEHPFEANLHLAKATVLTDLHVYDYALDVLAVADSYQVDRYHSTLQRAKVLAALGQHDEAFAELDTLPRTLEAELNSRRSTAEAIVFEHLHRYGDMYACLTDALHVWTGNLEALELLWICTELTGRHTDTANLCEEILAIDVYNSRAWYNLGHARHSAGDDEGSLMAFEYAYIIDPRYDLAYREAGEICIELGQYARAVDIFETMLEFVSGDNDVLLRLGQCYLHTDAFTQARLCINRVLSSIPYHDEALYYSGLCYAADGKWSSAIAAYRKAIDANGRAEQYVYALAVALIEIGDYLGAERQYARACELAPELAEYWLAHATLLYGLDRSQEALLVLDEAEEHTYSASLQYARVAVLLSLQREPEGLRLLADTLPEEWDARESLFAFAPRLRDHDLVYQVIRCFA